MIRHMLDTNACIAVLNSAPASVRTRLLECDPVACAISQVVHYELLYGAYHSQAVEQNLARIDQFLRYIQVLPWDENAARASARIRSELARVGRGIGPYDTLIAGHALAEDAALVSHNTKEFGRVEGLKLEDWEA